jgi:uncharacterized glyoxalase superfamily protein PhnB
MAHNPPNGFQRIIPYLFYEDVGTVMDFLIETCGFTEADRVLGPNGKVMHGEVCYQGNVAMMGQKCSETGDFKAMVYCYVDDVDSHYQQSKAAGAVMLHELKDQFYGDRSYGIKDPEGNLWEFATHIRDPTPEELAKGAAECAS